jgi:hypothetical protein
MVRGPGEACWPAREPGPVGQLARYHPPRRQLGDDIGDMNRGVAAVVVGEHLLVAGFGVVVELLGEPFPPLREEGVDILGGRGDLEHRTQQGDVAEVGCYRLGDIRVLHLYRDRAAIMGDRAVHLPDRRGGEQPGGCFAWCHALGRLRAVPAWRRGWLPRWWLP